MNPNFKRWTAEEDAELKRLNAEGLSDREIGKRLGRTKSAVYGRRVKYGLHKPGRRYPDEVRNECARRYLAGEFSTALAREIGATPHTVLKWVDRYIKEGNKNG